MGKIADKYNNLKVRYRRDDPTLTPEEIAFVEAAYEAKNAGDDLEKDSDVQSLYEEMQPEGQDNFGFKHKILAPVRWGTAPLVGTKIKYKRASECLVHEGGETGALHIPKYYRGSSFINQFVMMRSKRAGLVSTTDSTSFRYDQMPVDAFRNLKTVTQSVEKLFEKTGLHKDIQLLNDSIRLQANQVGEPISGSTTDTYSIGSAKAQIRSIIDDFVSDDDKQKLLKDFQADILKIRAAVNKNFIAVDKDRQYQGVDEMQKMATLDYLDYLHGMADNLQKVDFGETRFIDSANTDSDAKRLGFLLNFENSIANITQMGLDQKKKKANTPVYLRNALPRMLYEGYFCSKRNIDQDQTPREEGETKYSKKKNLESLLDVNGIKVADKMEGKNGKVWNSPADDIDLANSIFSLIKKNMLHEARYLVREIKWRAGYPDADIYKDAWVSELQNLVDRHPDNEYYAEAFALIEDVAIKDDRDGGGKAGILKNKVPLMNKMASAGTRRMQEFWIEQTFWLRICERFRGTSNYLKFIPISNPGQAIAFDKVKQKIKDISSYQLARVTWKEGPKGGEQVEKSGWSVPKNKEKNSDKKWVKRKKDDPKYIDVPFGKRFWYSKPMFLPRIWVRGFYGPLKATMTYGKNALIISSTLWFAAAGALHIAEEGIELGVEKMINASNDDEEAKPVEFSLNADVGSRMAGGYVEGASWLLAPGSLVSDGFAGLLKGGLNFIPGVDMGKGLFGSGHSTWDLIDGTVDEFHAFNRSVIGDRGSDDESFLAQKTNEVVKAVTGDNSSENKPGDGSSGGGEEVSSDPVELSELMGLEPDEVKEKVKGMLLAEVSELYESNKVAHEEASEAARQAGQLSAPNENGFLNIHDGLRASIIDKQKLGGGYIAEFRAGNPEADKVFTKVEDNAAGQFEKAKEGGARALHEGGKILDRSPKDNMGAFLLLLAGGLTLGAVLRSKKLLFATGLATAIYFVSSANGADLPPNLAAIDPDAPNVPELVEAAMKDPATAEFLMAKLEDPEFIALIKEKAAEANAESRFAAQESGNGFADKIIVGADIDFADYACQPGNGEAFSFEASSAPEGWKLDKNGRALAALEGNVSSNELALDNLA